MITLTCRYVTKMILKIVNLANHASDLSLNHFQAYNPLLGYPDLLKNTEEENPYVNEVAASYYPLADTNEMRVDSEPSPSPEGAAIDMYAKIDPAKKRNSRNNDDLRVMLPSDEDASAKIIKKFDVFFADENGQRRDGPNSVSHC